MSGFKFTKLFNETDMEINKPDSQTRDQLTKVNFVSTFKRESPRSEDLPSAAVESSGIDQDGYIINKYLLLVKDVSVLCCGLIGKEDKAIKFCACLTANCTVKKHKLVKGQIESGLYLRSLEDTGEQAYVSLMVGWKSMTDDLRVVIMKRDFKDLQECREHLIFLENSGSHAPVDAVDLKEKESYLNKAKEFKTPKKSRKQVDDLQHVYYDVMLAQEENPLNLATRLKKLGEDGGSTKFEKFLLSIVESLDSNHAVVELLSEKLNNTIGQIGDPVLNGPPTLWAGLVSLGMEIEGVRSTAMLETTAKRKIDDELVRQHKRVVLLSYDFDEFSSRTAQSLNAVDHRFEVIEEKQASQNMNQDRLARVAYMSSDRRSDRQTYKDSSYRGSKGQGDDGFVMEGLKNLDNRLGTLERFADSLTSEEETVSDKTVRIGRSYFESLEELVV
mmetsp:Transcript_20351/g.28600  ORF Transcript_20351/g.28600 Transcript_20351/m.28600 type:complete len:445 (+) Transcript_20351:652-1986(+)